MPRKKDSVQTLEELLDFTYRSIWKGSKGERTALMNAKDCIDILGRDMRVKDLDSRHIAQLIVRFRDGSKLAPGTINRKLAALSKMLSCAVDLELINRKPRVPRQKEPEHRTRYLTLAEEKKMFRLIKDEDEELERLCVFLVDTGCRVSEALRLRWEDIKDGWVEIKQTKAGEPRRIPLTGRAQLVLGKQLGSGALGPFENLSQNQLSYVWGKVKRQAGWVDDAELVPHCLRHTCASRLLQNGVGLVTVQQWLGHKSLQMTLRYAHLAPRQLEEAGKVLDRLAAPNDDGEVQ